LPYFQKKQTPALKRASVFLSVSNIDLVRRCSRAGTGFFYAAGELGGFCPTALTVRLAFTGSGFITSKLLESEISGHLMKSAELVGLYQR
jgi:hypothetical protein